MELTIHPITATEAREILAWRYGPPYDFYNSHPEELEQDLRGFLDPAMAYSSIRDDNGALAGFCCLGEDAQVPGGDYSEDALDIGMGLRPDLTGRGKGGEVLEAVLAYAREQRRSGRFRVTIAAFNQRARRLCERAGFVEEGEFIGSTRHGENRFVQYAREAAGRKQAPES